PSNPDNAIALDNQTIQANALIVYVGGASLGGNLLGASIPGGVSVSGTPSWRAAVLGRNQPGASPTGPAQTDFAPWGGSISFSTATNWSFSGSGGRPGPQQVDFLSVALRELGHLLGYGGSASWVRSVAEGEGPTFAGPHVVAAYGAPAPLDTVTYTIS